MLTSWEFTRRSFFAIFTEVMVEVCSSADVFSSSAKVSSQLHFTIFEGRTMLPPLLAVTLSHATLAVSFTSASGFDLLTSSYHFFFKSKIF